MNCAVVARMEEQILAGFPAALEVAISREPSTASATATVASTSSDSVDPNAPIDVRVFVRGDLRPLAGTEAQVTPPAANAPVSVPFTLRPQTVGESEVVVMITQGGATVGSPLVLKPQIVATRGANDREVQNSTFATDLGEPNELLPLLTVMQRQDATGSWYQYLLDLSAVGQGVLVTRTPEALGDVNEYVSAVYQKIERSWRDTQRDYAQFSQDLRTYGGRLCSELFDPEMQAALWRNRRQIKAIKVFSTEPFIPWELVHLKEPGKPVTQKETWFLGQLGLVRWKLGNLGPPRTLRVCRGRARYITPTYTGDEGFENLVEPAKEAKFLERAFQAKPVDGAVVPVRNLLIGGGFDLLHFSGHGAGDAEDLTGGRIILQGSRVDDDTGNVVANSLEPDFVSENANLDADDARPIIVLNACQAGRQRKQLTSMGGFSNAFIQRRAGAFIGTLWSVLDDSARTFVEALYRNLLKGQPIAQASAAARLTARKADDATWLAYVVYADPLARLTVEK